MAKCEDTYIGIIGNHYLQPLTLCIAKLVEKERGHIDGQSNNVEVDWTAASVILAFAYLEGVMSWTRTHRPDLADDRSAQNYYAALRKKIPDLPDMTEAFILRNAFAHNHIYAITKDDSGFTFALKDGGSKRDDLPNRLDAAGRGKTGLVLVPNLTTRRDVRLVLSGMAAALQELVKSDALLANILIHRAVWPDSTRLGFLDLPSRIE